MRILALLLVMTAALGAQCRLSDCKELAVTESTVSLTCDIDNVDTTLDLVRIARYTAGARDAESTQNGGFDPTDQVTGMTIWNMDFAAGVTGQEVFPEYSLDDGSTWVGAATCGSAVCPSGAGVQPGGYTCDANDMIVVNTDAAPSPGPVVAPTAPTHTNTGVAPTITGNTYTAASCATIQSQFDAAAAQANIDNLIHEVAWTATGVCHPGQFTVAAQSLDLCGVTTATGGVVFTGFWPDADLDRHGARPEADFFGHGPTLTWDPADWHPQESLIYSSCETRRVWFSEDYTWSFGTPTRDAIVAAQPADLTISSASGSDPGIRTFTLSGDVGITGTAFLRFHAPGIEDKRANWGGFLQVFPTADDIYTLGSVSGTWTSGGGLTRKRIHPFTATAATEPVLTMNHVLGDGYAYSITSVTSDVLTTTGAHKIPTTSQAVLISGCGAADGVNYGTGGSQAGGTLNLGRTVGDCTGGTVQALYMVQLSNLSGINTDALSCVFTTQGLSTSIKLLECTDGVTNAQADWSAGSGITGDASFDPRPYPHVVDLGGIKESSFAGFVIRGSQDSQPWATIQGAFKSNDQYSEDNSVTDSFVGSAHIVRALSPVTTRANETDHNTTDVASILYVDNTQGFYARGVDAIGSGFYTFSQTSQNHRAPRDLTICGGRMIYDERFVGGTASRGFLVAFRQGMELKEGARQFLFCGLTFWQVPVVSVKTNAAITVQYSANATQDTEAGGFLNGVEDGRIENIYGSGRLFTTYGTLILGGSRYNRFTPVDRAVIRNNLWFHREGLHSATCGDDLNGTAAFCAADFTNIHAGHPNIARANNLEFANNTFGLADSDTDYSYWWELDKNVTQASAYVHDNSHIVSRGAVYRDIRCSFVYSAEWAGQCEDAWTIEGAASSRFVMENTKLIPCTLSPSDSDWSATNAAHTDNSGAYVNWKAGSLPTIITGSADSQSCWDRVALGFDSNWGRKAALGGAGHDHTELLDALGVPVIPAGALERNVATHRMRLTGYRAPNNGACTLTARAASVDHGGAGLSAVDTGSRTNRSVVLDVSSLTGQTIKLELLCAQGVIHHWQGTAP